MDVDVDVDVDAEDGLDAAARIGLVARGLVYVVFGLIAFNLARGDDNSGEPSTKGALAELSGKPYGGALLVLLAVGLACYAVACAAGAIRGHGGKRAGHSDTGDRLLDAGRAVVNGALAVLAYRVFRSGRDEVEQGSETEQELTARILDWPLGRWLVIAVGLVLAGRAVWQVRKAFTGSFEKGLSLTSLSHGWCEAVRWLGRVGYVARGMVFVLVAWFLVQAGLDHDAGDAVGIDGALQRVVRADWGPTVLAGIGIGVIAFGLWSAVEARFRIKT